MNIQVRYYSRSGNTKLLAEAIASVARVPALSVDTAGSQIDDDCDLLFVGGALYAYGIDKHLKKWLTSLDGKKVKKAVVFSTSWLSKHSLEVICKSLEEKGIQVLDETIYYKSTPSDDDLEEAKQTVKRIIQ